MLLLSTHPSTDSGGGVQHPPLRTPADGIPHLAGIQTPLHSTRRFHGRRPQICDLDMCVYVGVVCAFLICNGGIVVMGALSFSILFKYESNRDICLF